MGRSGNKSLGKNDKRRFEMTKLEIVDKIFETVAQPKKEIEKVIDEFVRITQETLKAGDKVSLTGLGSLATKDRAARTARNPKTGAQVQVPAKKVVKFKPGKELIEVLKEASSKQA
jgi:DNA-binding protein HU-beta